MPQVNEPGTGRVLVLGGQGVLGAAIAGAFGAAGWTTIRAGRRPDSGAGFRPVDLDQPDTPEPALRDIDLPLSTAPDERPGPEPPGPQRGGGVIHVPGRGAVGAPRPPPG